MAEVYAMIDSLGDIGGTLKLAKPAGLARLYRKLDLSLRYVPGERAGHRRSQMLAFVRDGDTVIVRGFEAGQAREQYDTGEAPCEFHLAQLWPDTQA